MSRRSAVRYEQILAREGMPAELPSGPSWRRLAHSPRRLGHVELPADHDGYAWTVADRARHFVREAEFSPGYNAKLEELYWRGDWRGFPKWHRQLVWEHTQDGRTVAEFARARRLAYAQAWRALDEHKRRAGIGDMEKQTSTNGSKDHSSRVEQTAAVRVKVVFDEKLDPHLGLGHIKYAEGELVMGGRFVRIEYQADRPHATHDHVLVPVGAGMKICVLKD